MHVFVTALFLAICIIANLPDVNGKCAVGNYKALQRVYQECSYNQRTADSLNQEKRSADGKMLCNVFKNYCRNRYKIHNCVKDFLRRSGCSLAVRKGYDNLIATSDWYCDRKKVQPFIANIYGDIGAVGTLHSTDRCMRVAKVKQPKCSAAVKLASVKLKRKLTGQEILHNHMMCTLEELKTAEYCPIQESVLTTTLVFAQMVLPPLLGVNVSKVILEMDEFARTHP